MFDRARLLLRFARAPESTAGDHPNEWHILGQNSAVIHSSLLQYCNLKDPQTVALKEATSTVAGFERVKSLKPPASSQM